MAGAYWSRLNQTEEPAMYVVTKQNDSKQMWSATRRAFVAASTFEWTMYKRARDAKRVKGWYEENGRMISSNIITQSEALNLSF
jgi:hypothetical protein